MRRALIITYYWPPTGGSGVQRWVKFAKYLPKQGWQPVIYTPENPEMLAVDASLEAEVPPEAEVIKTHIREPYAVYRRLLGKKKDARGAGLNPINSQKKTFVQKLMLWIRSNFFVPDPRIGWVKPSVKFLKEYLREHPVDVMVTTGPPQSMHLIGLRLHRMTGIPWVADFRDPWTKMHYFKHLELGRCALKKHLRLEQEVLDGCSAVISVTSMVQEDFSAQTSTPVHLVTNGYDAPDFEAPLPERADGIFRVVHTGLFASDGDPVMVWKALASRCAADPAFSSALRIRLAGKVDPEIIESIRSYGLGDKLEMLGYLPHEESVAELRNADIILLPLRRDPEYRKALPGKIFECLAAGRPVLGTGQEDGAAALLIAETGAGRMFDWDKDPGEFIDAVASGSFVPARKGIEKYSRLALSAQMAELFDSLV